MTSFSNHNPTIITHILRTVSIYFAFTLTNSIGLCNNNIKYSFQTTIVYLLTMVYNSMILLHNLIYTFISKIRVVFEIYLNNVNKSRKSVINTIKHL